MILLFEISQCEAAFSCKKQNGDLPASFEILAVINIIHISERMTRVCSGLLTLEFETNASMI